MNQKPTDKLFPIDPNSSLLDGVSVDEVFKGKQKSWQEARNRRFLADNTQSDSVVPKRNKKP